MIEWVKKECLQNINLNYLQASYQKWKNWI